MGNASISYMYAGSFYWPTVITSTVTITSRVSIRFTFMHVYIPPTIITTSKYVTYMKYSGSHICIMCSFTQEPTCTSSTSQQDTEVETMNQQFLWMIIAVVFTALAILSTIITFVLGAVICHARRSSKLAAVSKTTHRQGIFTVKIIGHASSHTAKRKF